MVYQSSDEQDEGVEEQRGAGEPEDGLPEGLRIIGHHVCRGAGWRGPVSIEILLGAQNRPRLAVEPTQGRPITNN